MAVVNCPLAVVTWPIAIVTWPLAVIVIAVAITITILVIILMQGGVVTAGRPGDYGRAYLTIRSDALTNEKLPYQDTNTQKGKHTRQTNTQTQTQSKCQLPQRSNKPRGHQPVAKQLAASLADEQQTAGIKR